MRVGAAGPNRDPVRVRRGSGPLGSGDPGHHLDDRIAELDAVVALRGEAVVQPGVVHRGRGHLRIQGIKHPFVVRAALIGKAVEQPTGAEYRRGHRGAPGAIQVELVQQPEAQAVAAQGNAVDDPPAVLPAELRRANEEGLAAPRRLHFGEPADRIESLQPAVHSERGHHGEAAAQEAVAPGVEAVHDPATGVAAVRGGAVEPPVARLHQVVGFGAVGEVELVDGGDVATRRGAEHAAVAAEGGAVERAVAPEEERVRKGALRLADEALHRGVGEHPLVEDAEGVEAGGVVRRGVAVEHPEPLVVAVAGDAVENPATRHDRRGEGIRGRDVGPLAPGVGAAVVRVRAVRPESIRTAVAKAPEDLRSLGGSLAVTDPEDGADAETPAVRGAVEIAVVAVHQAARRAGALILVVVDEVVQDLDLPCRRDPEDRADAVLAALRRGGVEIAVGAHRNGAGVAEPDRLDGARRGTGPEILGHAHPAGGDDRRGRGLGPLAGREQPERRGGEDLEVAGDPLRSGHRHGSSRGPVIQCVNRDRGPSYTITLAGPLDARNPPSCRKGPGVAT